MKKYQLLTPVLLLASVSAVNATEMASNDAVLSSAEIDKLSSQELYWNKVNTIETQKNAALTLKVQNGNLIKAGGGVQDHTADSKVRNLKEFMELSLSGKELIGEDSKSQEDLISDHSQDLVHNIEVMGSVDGSGNGELTEGKNSSAQLKQMQKQQTEFFEEMVNFVNDKLDTGSKESEAEVQVAPDGSVASVAEVQPEQTQQQQQEKFSYDSSLTQERGVDVFTTPAAIIKRVGKSGVEIVFVYSLKDNLDEPAFVTAKIKEGQEELTVHPMIIYPIKYKVVEYSSSKIVLVDENNAEVVATR